MSRRQGKSQSGYSQLLEGSNLVSARAVNLNCHHKHCYHIAKAIRGMNAEDAKDYLEDVVSKKKAIPYQRRSRKGRGGNTMAGHRKGKLGPGKFPHKASLEFIKLINSAMDNARQRFDDIDAEDMVITHVAAHRGQVATNMRPRARGRATPSNHYQVNLEIFLEYFDEDEVLEQEDEDF
ncbi:MAG: 50S ribosomal protein L22 [Euryarchaeota archaeon]|jgi:large subunit ribosomal protein L22|nr:50S ribosomal protein L22 [Euryarchaeota archaeon]|tara:strand:- start:2040 stop:2576 length:537 start_codon:yes stop_codon:yes gene_type:complete